MWRRSETTIGGAVERRSSASLTRIVIPSAASHLVQSEDLRNSPVDVEMTEMPDRACVCAQAVEFANESGLARSVAS